MYQAPAMARTANTTTSFTAAPAATACVSGPGLMTVRAHSPSTGRSWAQICIGREALRGGRRGGGDARGRAHAHQHLADAGRQADRDRALPGEVVRAERLVD